MRPGRLRVIGGAFRGRRLKVGRGDSVRPTGDRVREAIFDILGDSVGGATVLDAYAGTGALGIESLSRGARHATFVEKDGSVIEVLRHNVALDPGIAGRSRIFASDLAVAMRTMGGEGLLYDFVFLDPPYGAELARGLRLVHQGGILAPGALIIAEHDTREFPGKVHGLVPGDVRRYGRTSISFFRAAAVV